MHTDQFSGSTPANHAKTMVPDSPKMTAREASVSVSSFGSFQLLSFNLPRAVAVERAAESAIAAICMDSASFHSVCQCGIPLDSILLLLCTTAVRFPVVVPAAALRLRISENVFGRYGHPFRSSQISIPAKNTTRLRFINSLKPVLAK